MTITDDDTAGVTVSESALTVTEEDTTGDTYTVVLNSQPTADVTITIGGQSGPDVTAAPSPMTFTADQLGHGPDGDGDGRRRCEPGERDGLADTQRRRAADSDYDRA